MSNQVRLRQRAAIVSMGERAGNWLQDLDSRAKRRKPARSWLGYPFFMFERYPHLRPQENTIDKERRVNLASSRIAFEEFLHDWEIRLEQHPKAVRALKGLSTSQRRQLAALVGDTQTSIIEHFGSPKSNRQNRGSKGWHKRLQTLAKNAPGAKRKLNAKLTRSYCKTLRKTMMRQAI